MHPCTVSAAPAGGCGSWPRGSTTPWSTARFSSRRERTRGATPAACCTTPVSRASQRPGLAANRVSSPPCTSTRHAPRSSKRAALAECSTRLSLQAVQHLQRQLVTAERRHQIGALDALAHREQHLARDLHALLARGLAAGRLAHPLADHFGDLHAGDFVVEELGILVAHQREHADQHGHLQVLDAPQHRLEQIRLEDRLRHDELGAGLPLFLEAGELLVEIRRAPLEARREEKRRLAAGQRLAGGGPPAGPFLPPPPEAPPG